MKTGIVVLFTLIGSSVFAQTQYKHDLGLRLGSNGEERFQLQYRMHPNEKWAFGATATVGSTGSGNSSFSLEPGDSTYTSYSYNYNNMFYGVTFDAVRKLNFMKHNYYYAGASLGVTSLQRSYNSISARYEAVYLDSTNTYMPAIGDLLESESTQTLSNGIMGRSRIFVGADVPIFDRLTLNVEVGFDAALTRIVYPSAEPFVFMYGSFTGFVSGGLRYRFGKSE